MVVNNTHILATDNLNHRVQIFDLTGTFKAKIGAAGGVSGTGDGEFNRPNGIAMNSTHFFVADVLNILNF